MLLRFHRLMECATFAIADEQSNEASRKVDIPAQMNFIRLHPSDPITFQQKECPICKALLRKYRHLGIDRSGTISFINFRVS